MWNNMIKPAFVLFIVCAVIAASLAWVYSITAPIIEDRRQQEEEMAKKQVLNFAHRFEEKEDTALSSDMIKALYRGIKEDKTVGYVFKVESKGYSGIIQMTVGINTEGKITGLSIGDHKETPGLGSKAEEPGFKDQFIGILPKASLQVVKNKSGQQEEIQAITGATITSKAVTNGVQAALEAFETVMKEER